jgi:hypothetical protein
LSQKLPAGIFDDKYSPSFFLFMLRTYGSLTNFSFFATD